MILARHHSHVCSRRCIQWFCGPETLHDFRFDMEVRRCRRPQHRRTTVRDLSGVVQDSNLNKVIIHTPIPHALRDIQLSSLTEEIISRGMGEARDVRLSNEPRRSIDTVTTKG